MSLLAYDKINKTRLTHFWTKVSWSLQLDYLLKGNQTSFDNKVHKDSIYFLLRVASNKSGSNGLHQLQHMDVQMS